MCSICVGESEHAICLFLKISIARRVVDFARCMERPVKFDNEFVFYANKIDDVATDQVLAPEFVSPEFAVAHLRPEKFFQHDGFVAHLACAAAIGC